MAEIVIMPKQGLQMTEGTIISWLKKVGDEVSEGEPLFEMETDKLTITIDSTFTGTLLKILKEEGETVPITEPIAIIGSEGEDISALVPVGGAAEQNATGPAGDAATVQADPSLNVVIMPKQGLQMTEGTVISWLKKVGDEVSEGEPLFEMETDKLTITIDSTFTGTLLKILKEEGETVPITEPIAIIGEKGKDVSGIDFGSAKPSGNAEKPESAPVPADRPAEPVKVSAPAPMPVKRTGRVFITPRAKMRCVERGIDDWSSIQGSGPDGLIIERDVLSYVIPAPAALTAAVQSCAKITVSVNIAEVKKYVDDLTNGGNAITLTDIIQKASAAAAKRLEGFNDITVKSLAGTSVLNYSPEFKPEMKLLLSAGGVNDGKLILAVSFREDEYDAETIASFISSVAALLENPLLMLAI